MLLYRTTTTSEIRLCYIRPPAGHCADLFTMLIQDPWLSKWRPCALIKQNKALHRMVWSKLHCRKNKNLRLHRAPPLPVTCIFSSLGPGRPQRERERALHDGNQIPDFSRISFSFLALVCTISFTFFLLVSSCSSFSALKRAEEID